MTDVFDQEIVEYSFADFPEDTTRKSLNAGDLLLEIIEAKIGKTKTTDKPRLELKFSATDMDGNHGVVFDNIVIVPNCKWKIKSLYSAINRLDLYEKKLIRPSEILNHTCKGIGISVKNYNDQEKSHTEIKEYLVPKSSGNKVSDIVDEGIPF